MLGKLMKYELKATGRIFLPLFAALLLVAVISKLFMSLSFEIPMVIGIAVSVIMIIGIFIITLIITLQRFYKNLLTNEGYLMFTLPVNTDSIIWSKLLVASVWNILSFVIVGAAIAIMALGAFNLSEAIQCMMGFLAGVGINGATLSVFIIEFIFLSLSSLLSGILTFYACMSVSLFSNKYRILISFAAFIGFNTIGQIISSIAAAIAMKTNLPNVFMGWTLNTQIHAGQLSMIIVNIAVGVIFYFLSRYMLKNKLNLE